MAGELQQEHDELIREVADNNGFKDYQVETEAGSEKGDGYTGKLFKVTIKDSEKQLKLFLKVAHPIPEIRKEIPMRDVYLKEIYVYEKLFQVFDDFQLKHDLTDGLNHARFYGKCDKDLSEALVFENLLESGYGLWNRKLPMDPRHITLVMKEYGKLHAISLAMIHKDPVLFEELTKPLRKPITEKEKRDYKFFVASAGQQLSKIAEGDDELEAAVQGLLDRADNFILETLEGETAATRISVVMHGDCWCNNMLFKYGDTDPLNPSKVCLIDWQLSRIGPPLQDIAYFFCGSSPKEVLDDYKRYLKIYHDSLSECLKTMSCDPATIYPYSVFEEEWKVMAKYGLFIAPIILRIQLVEKEEALDLNDGSVKSSQEFFDYLEKGSDEKVLTQRLRDLLRFMKDNEFI